MISPFYKILRHQLIMLPETLRHTRWISYQNKLTLERDQIRKETENFVWNFLILSFDDMKLKVETFNVKVIKVSLNVQYFSFYQIEAVLFLQIWRIIDYHRVIHLGILTRKPVIEMESQFVYLCSLLSNTLFVERQNASKSSYNTIEVSQRASWVSPLQVSG